jgi:hypothetical protein
MYRWSTTAQFFSKLCTPVPSPPTMPLHMSGWCGRVLACTWLSVGRSKLTSTGAGGADRKECGGLAGCAHVLRRATLAEYRAAHAGHGTGCAVEWKSAQLHSSSNPTAEASRGSAGAPPLPGIRRAAVDRIGACNGVEHAEQREMHAARKRAAPPALRPGAADPRRAQHLRSGKVGRRRGKGMTCSGPVQA